MAELLMAAALWLIWGLADIFLRRIEIEKLQQEYDREWQLGNHEGCRKLHLKIGKLQIVNFEREIESACVPILAPQYAIGVSRSSQFSRVAVDEFERELEEQRQLNELGRIRRLINLLTLLWQRILESLIFFSNFSVFPNKHRPPCTTMPWNIRPALVVLWGVCWMFYDRRSPIDSSLQSSLEDEIIVPSSCKVLPHLNFLLTQLTFCMQT
jgi:hypothetical protein